MSAITKTIIAAVGVLTFGICAAANAQVYRCDTPGGVTYSDHACGPSAERMELIEGTTTGQQYGFQRYLQNKQPQALLPTPATRPSPPTRSTSAPPVNVDVQPQVDCPSQDAIEQAIRRRQVTLCMTPAQVRSATPIRASGFTQLQNFDQFGSFTEWRYVRVPDRDFPVRIQFRNGQVFGFETLPISFRD